MVDLRLCLPSSNADSFVLFLATRDAIWVRLDLGLRYRLAV